MTKRIPLTQGAFALIDDNDYERVSQFKWQLGRIGSMRKPYATRTEAKKTIYMHRFILNAPHNAIVDHVDGNTLDNRRSNIRLCSHTENMQNSKRQSNNTSGYKGVYLQRNSRWVAHISVNNKNIHIGSFDTAEDAARAYDAAAIEIYGEFAKTNFEKSQ